MDENGLRGYVCVFGASGRELRDVFIEAARELGTLLAQHRWGCVNGAGSEGLMRAVSDGVLDGGGEAVGVIPQFMVDKGWHYDRLTRLIVTRDMHERKERMNALSVATVALPGGCGTLEELLELITWRQLHLTDKPIIILNTDHYYDHLLAMLARADEDGFMRPTSRQLWHVAATPIQSLNLLEHELTLHSQL